jgi:hypothetical protein
MVARKGILLSKQTGPNMSGVTIGAAKSAFIARVYKNCQVYEILSILIEGCKIKVPVVVQ